MNNNFSIVRAVLKKDCLSLLPLVLLTAGVHMLDVFVLKLSILPLFAVYMPVLWISATALLLFAVLQLDSPVSLIDDWLCRPVPKRALVSAKLLLLLAGIYLPRVLATFTANLMLDYTFVEALQEALLLQMNQPLVLLSAVLIIALITPNVVQGMGTLLALVVAVTIFAGERGAQQSGAGNGLSENGMVWMASAPVKVLVFALVGMSIWAAYRYRNVVLGRWLLVGGAVASALTIFTPIKADWHTVYALQKAVSPYDAAGMQAVNENLNLYHTNACFPSIKVGALTGDAAYDSAREAFGMNPWTEAALQEAGQDGLLFITRVQPHGIPRDWRMSVAHVQAVFTDADSGEQIAVRPAEVGSTQMGAAFSHQWLLQQDDVTRLVQGTPSLELTYSLAVLKPLTHELPADGVRRKLDGLGYCGATRDNLNNRLVVDCFDGGAHAPQISAQLAGIESSRVYSSPDYAPALIQATGGRRIQLNVGPASLLPSAIVEVTAWQLAGFVDASVRSGGVLGNTVASCPLPALAPPALQSSNWQDGSPHTASYVVVDDGVQLEVLDWGGTGMPLLLIPGLGATAHTWDDIAPLLAQNYRVLGLTRRGIGASSRPQSGYDTATLARDVVRVLDTMGIDKAIIVGWSIAGEELSWLGAEYPERVAGLVYLDAAFDRVAMAANADFDALPTSLPPQPPMAADDLRSYATVLRYMERVDIAPSPEGEMLALLNISNRFMAGLPAVDMRLLDAIVANLQRPRFEAISVPVLALYAMPEGPNQLMKPWYDRNDPEVVLQVAARAEAEARLKRDQRRLFQQLVPGAETKELLGATHGLHLSAPDEVIAEIRNFVDRIQAAGP